MTNSYITRQQKLETLPLKFIQYDFPVWRDPAVWVLRFGGIVLAWMWFLTCFAAWPGRVPDDELGAVWFSFAGFQLHMPWAGLLWTQRAEGLPVGAAWLLRLCGLIMVVPAIMIARLVLNDCPRLPRKEDSFAYGGHLLEDADYRSRLGQAGSSGVMVGSLKRLPWQKLSRLVRIAPSTECLVLGEGRFAKSVYDAALKSFEGTIIRVGAQRLSGGLVAESDIIRINSTAGASCPLDPLRQVRAGTLAWFDLQAMLFPCGFNERQRILATALLVHALETAPIHRRTFADVVYANDDVATDIYARLNGWVNKTPLLTDKSRNELEGLLDYWAQAQDQVADDLPIIRERLWAVQRGWPCSTYGDPPQTIADAYFQGPRVVSFEMRPQIKDDETDALILPLMHLTLLFRHLICQSSNKERRPILIALDADAPARAVWLINLVRADLKELGVSLLVHAHSAGTVHQAFSFDARTRLNEKFGTIVVTNPNDLAHGQVMDLCHTSLLALASPGRGEIVVVQAGRRPVRLHAAHPAMVPIIATGPYMDKADHAEPWSAPATAYPLGKGLPKPKTIKIPKPTATPEPESSASRMAVARAHVPTNAPSSQPFVTRDDLASSTARLRKALAKRKAAPLPTQPRTI